MWNLPELVDKIVMIIAVAGAVLLGIALIIEFICFIIILGKGG